MYIKTKNLFFAILGLSLFISCSTDNDSKLDTESSPEIGAFELNSRTQLPTDVNEAIVAAGLNPGEFQYKEINLLGKGKQSVIITNEDIAYSRNEFMDILRNGANDQQSEQYATEFQVDTNTYNVINLYVYVGADQFGLTPGAVQGVEDAVDNWNNSYIPSDIQFEITLGTNPNYDTNVFETAIVSQPNVGGFGGFAEFPRSNNSPGSFVVISPDANQFANLVPDAIEHLITHELGHTIGFRHTDWDTRRSCVEAGLADEEVNEGGIATYINGTLPTFFYQSNSIMNGCFNVNTTSGELNVFDRVALSELYPAF